MGFGPYCPTVGLCSGPDGQAPAGGSYVHDGGFPGERESSVEPEAGSLPCAGTPRHLRPLQTRVALMLGRQVSSHARMGYLGVMVVLMEIASGPISGKSGALRPKPTRVAL